MEGKFYAISGWKSEGDKFALTQLDLSKIDSYLVSEKLIQIYTHNDFNKKEFGLDLKPFNIRDILIYNRHTEDVTNYKGYINFMISWYSNGLMFFQINLIDSGIINEGSTSKVDIKFSDIEEISGGIGRIFIVDNSIYDVSNFTVILTSPVPPMIYEVVISDNNPIMHVQQAIKSEYSNFHFYGEDFVAATSSYIALLVYDRRAWQYCIVIINRKDYTNSFGHSIIPLNDHINRITGMIFTWTNGWNTLFIKDSTRSQIYEVRSIDLVTWTDGWNTLFIKDSTRSQIYEIRSIDLVINTDEDHYDEFNKIKHNWSCHKYRWGSLWWI